MEGTTTQAPVANSCRLYLKDVGKIDLAGTDFLIHAIREIRAKGRTFHVVSRFPPLLECLRRFHALKEQGEDFLHISRGDALTSAISYLNYGTCKTCRKRVSTECAKLPGGSEAD